MERAWTDVKLANVLYHDWEATTYDEKWSISYDQRCIDYARDRFTAVAGSTGWPYAEALELGSGTGFFLLNLMQAGVATTGHVTDLSPGMVEAAVRNGTALGLDVDGRVADAESSRTTTRASTSWSGTRCSTTSRTSSSRCARCSGCSSPAAGSSSPVSRRPSGDWYARHLGRLTWQAATTVTRLAPLRERWARPEEELAESSRAAALESVVDIHTFDPRALAATALRAGAVDVRTVTEELTAAFLGWPVRTFEAAVNPERLGLGWAMFAYRSWQRLSAVDRLLARALPQQLVLQRAAHRDPAGVSRREPDPRQVPLRRFVSPESLRWVLRHRAYTPYYLVRYWRFLRLRLRHPQVVTEGFVFLGRDVEITARRGYGRVVLGRWVHLGDRCSLRAHEGTLRIGDEDGARPRGHPQLLPRPRGRRRAASWPTGCTWATSTTGSTTCTCPSRTRGS